MLSLCFFFFFQLRARVCCFLLTSACLPAAPAPQVPEDGRQPERGPGEVHAHLRRCLLLLAPTHHPVTPFSVIVRARPLPEMRLEIREEGAFAQLAKQIFSLCVYLNICHADDDDDDDDDDDVPQTC